MDDMAEKIQSLLGDEESMRQIKELAEMFGGNLSAESGSSGSAPSVPAGSSSDGEDSLFGNINPLALMQLMEAFSRKDPGCELIMALRPLLSKDKQLKADKAVKMLKLYNVYMAMKEQGMLNNLF